jgi:tetratricopeptide (TPR) repeat protein
LLRLRGKGAGPTAFYAQSWALADMLVLSPEYGSKLRPLIGALAAMTPEEAFASVHGRTLDGIAADLRAWIDRRKSIRPLRLPGVPIGADAVSVAAVPRLRIDLMLAGLMLDAGDLSRAETAYGALLRDALENGDVHAGLGTIALQRGRRDEARELWSRALALGVSDDALCFRYTALAQNAGLSEADVRPVLQRAIEIRPAFDDARYALALIEKNAGRAQSALDHLRAMREPGQSRVFGYWSAVSDALNSLERHDEAEAAARNAAAHATTPAERAHAGELAFIARTEIAVQAVPDAQGRPRMVTTRIPRRTATANWNPFVEPLDDVRTIEGELREVDCDGPVTRIVVEAGAARQTLAIPDPARVQMRNAPSEFTCGPQSGGKVIVVYAAPRTPAADAIVRGIEFRP